MNQTSQLKEQLVESNERIIELEKLHKQKVENIGILNQDRHKLQKQLAANEKELSCANDLISRIHERWNVCGSFMYREVRRYLKINTPK